MTAGVELDPVFRQALKLLHSPNSDAAENIRKSLDDVIRQKHGPNKMLINTLSKKHILEEGKAGGSGVMKSASGRRASHHKSSDSSSNNSNSSPVQITTTCTPSTTTVIATDLNGKTQEIPIIISLPDPPANSSIAADDDNAMDNNINKILFEDLVCVTCRQIDQSAKNSLIECVKCTSLYHQECHNPPIKAPESSWCCSDCKAKKPRTSSTKLTASPSKSNNSSSSTSSSSSNSNAPVTLKNVISGSSSSSKKDKDKEKDKEKEKEKEKKEGSSSSSSKSKNSSSRHHSSSSHHHSSTSSSHHSSKHERSVGSSSDKSSSSNSSKSSVTPNIHIISADKRLQNMKKKAAKSQETKRKK